MVVAFLVKNLSCNFPLVLHFLEMDIIELSK